MTREEAINEIKSWDFLEGKEIEAIHTLIPELVESEDERIRKWIVKFLVEQYPELWKDKKNKMLAYLEKQKEQKPADNPKWAELTWKDINELERIINNVHYEFQNGIGEDSFGELVLERFREYKDDGSMDEQKPAKWSEEDKRAIDRACVALRAYANGDLPEFLPSELIGYADRLQSLRPSWKPNDEDEVRLINTSISFLKDFADKGYENAVECIDWLKSKLNGNTCE